METEECTTTIPKLEEDIYNLNIKLSQEEKKLDQIRESSNGERTPQPPLNVVSNLKIMKVINMFTLETLRC